MSAIAEIVLSLVAMIAGGMAYGLAVLLLIVALSLVAGCVMWVVRVGVPWVRRAR